MAGIPIFKASFAVSAAAADGTLTVADTTPLYPGTTAWLTKNDASKQDYVRILQILTSTTIKVGPASPVRGPTGFYSPSYQIFDASADNGIASTMGVETQVAPVDVAYSKRTGT